MVNIQNVHYSFFIKCALRSSEMLYGDRCRATLSVEGLFHRHQDKMATMLKPRELVQKEKGQRAHMMSGQEISTPRGSSKRKLLGELLELIHDLSGSGWETPDDLNISLKSLEPSSDSEDSSEWEMLTPPSPPPMGGDPPRSHFEYVPFCKKHAYDCEDFINKP
nr:ORF3 [Torque teno felis virus]